MVAVIAISAALAAPAISRTMADRRAVEATQGLIRIGARARGEAMAYGVAFLLRYARASTGGNNGRVELWRGNVDRCSANDWSTLAGTCAGNPRCVSSHDMGTYVYPSHSVRMRLTGADAADLCFEPHGDMFVSTGGAFATVPPSGADAVLFTFDRLEGTRVAGVQRRVVFPFGAGPRMAR